MANFDISSKDIRELLTRFQAEENWQLERLENVETLTDISSENGIASVIIQFVKKCGTDG